MREIHKTSPVLHAKAITGGDEPGMFEAVVSVFGNVDSDGDIVAQGAFAKTLADGPKPIVWSHDWLLPPIGQTLDAAETDEGLRVKGRLFVADDEDHSVARQVYAAMRAGALKEFSWGGCVVEETRRENDDGTVTYTLEEIDLVEYGPCLKGANPATRLVGVKADDGYIRVPRALLADPDGLAELLKARDQTAKGVLAVTQLPFAARETGFDGGQARKAVRAWATTGGGDVDMGKYAKAFLWRDDDAPADNLTSYRFIVADVISGQLKYVPRAIFAAANVLMGGRGGTTVDDAGQAALKKSIEQLYSRMRGSFDDDTIVVPWADKAQGTPSPHRGGASQQQRARVAELLLP